MDLQKNLIPDSNSLEPELSFYAADDYTRDISAIVPYVKPELGSYKISEDCLADKGKKLFWDALGNKF